MKGHLTIELRDVNTGEIEVYEDDNMATSAIEQMVNFAAKHALGTSSLDIYASHWSNLLGGLILFDSAIPEDADQIYPPAGVKPVGYGQYNDTNAYTNYPEWGIYNTQESDVSQPNTKKFVWDFATNHVNNRIACVCLTHRNAGLFGAGVETWRNTGRANLGQIALGTVITQSSKGKQAQNSNNYGVVGQNLSLSDGSYVDFCVDSVNDVKYMFKVCLDGISIIKHNLYPEKFDVFRSSAYYQEFVEETYAETFAGSYFYHFYNPDEQMLYFWTTSSETSYTDNSVSIYIHRFDMENKVLTKNWRLLSFTMPSSSSYKRIYNNYIVTNDGIYIIGDNSEQNLVWFVDIGGTASVVFKNESGRNASTDFKMGRKNYICNGLIYLNSVLAFGSGNNAYYNLIIDTDDNSVRYTNTQSRDAYYLTSGYSKATSVPPIDNTQIVFGSMVDAGSTLDGNVMNLQQTESNTSQIGNMFANICYLGTINNLAEPIIKTAQQTMKLTYTITSESEE